MLSCGTPVDVTGNDWPFRQEIYEEVYVNVLVVTVIAAVLPFLMTNVFMESFLNFILSSLVSFICTGITIYYIGCNKIERKLLQINCI